MGAPHFFVPKQDEDFAADFKVLVRSSASSLRDTIQTTKHFFYGFHHVVVHCIRNWHSYCRQTQRSVIISWIYATCFGRAAHPRGFQ